MLPRNLPRIGRRFRRFGRGLGDEKVLELAQQPFHPTVRGRELDGLGFRLVDRTDQQPAPLLPVPEQLDPRPLGEPEVVERFGPTLALMLTLLGLLRPPVLVAL